MKRNGIFERDEFRCVYCGGQFIADELTLDHVQPRVRGGDRSEGNLVTTCRACNTLKGQHRQGDGGGASMARMRSLSDAVVARAEAANASAPIWSSAPGSARLDIRV